jgi:outer membrane lipoprotein SlyB
VVIAVTESSSASTHSVVAAFQDAESAEGAVTDLRESGIDPSNISTDSRTDLLTIANAEMREESTSVVAAPGVMATEEQSKGGVKGSLAGVVVGAALGGALGYVLIGGRGAVIAAIVGAVGGLVVGLVMGGLSRPRRVEGPRRSLEGYDVAVGVHSDDEGEIEKAESVLQKHDPSRIERRASPPPDPSAG